MGRLALLTLPAVGVALGATWLLTGATAEDPVTLVNSGNGLPVLQVADMSPGASRSSEVTLQNAGDQPGDLTLALTDVNDAPPNGGQLSSHLLLSVEDLNSGEQWAAPWNDFSQQSLGQIRAGEARTFRLTVTLPDGRPGGSDDTLQGSATGGDLIWRATIGDPVPPPEPPSGGTPPGTETVPPVSPKPQAGRAPQIRLDLDGAQAQILTTRSLSFVVRCDERCRITAYAIIPGPGGRHIRTRTVTRTQRARQPVRVRVRIPLASLTRIRRKLSHHQRVSIRLVIDARDSAGNTRTLKRVVKLGPKRKR